MPEASRAIPVKSGSTKIPTRRRKPRSPRASRRFWIVFQIVNWACSVCISRSRVRCQASGRGRHGDQEDDPVAAGPHVVSRKRGRPGSVARAVLALLLTTAGLLGAAEPQTCSPPVDTPAATKTEIQNLHQALKSGPFYGELVRRFGKPLSCTMDLDAGNISISYAFRDSVQLVTRVSRSIESSEQRVDLPRMDTKRAIGLLREAEKAAYRPRGCGIAWNRPERDKS